MTAELEYMNEENGRLRREIATWKAETQALIKRAEDAEAELARLKAQEPVAWLISSKDWWPESVAVTQKPTGLLGNETLQPLYLASGAAPNEPTSDSELAELCIQWFNAVQDLNPTYLETADFELAKKLYERVGRRVPSSIYNGIASGAAPKENKDAV